MALNLAAIGRTIGPVTGEYDWKDIVLYALGVGADFDELDYVYENQHKVIPTFAILSIYGFFGEFITASGVNLAGILHGEHELIMHGRIPAEGGTLASEGRITAMYDKGEGKGALIYMHQEGRGCRQMIGMIPENLRSSRVLRLPLLQVAY